MGNPNNISLSRFTKFKEFKNICKNCNETFSRIAIPLFTKAPCLKCCKKWEDREAENRAVDK